MPVTDLGCGAYFKDGKVLRFMREGMAGDAGPEKIERILDGLFADTFDPPLFGRLSACLLYPAHQELPDGSDYVQSQCHFADLPEHVKAGLRREVPEYANEF